MHNGVLKEFLTMLLLLCGDIEKTPGPTSNEQAETLSKTCSVVQTVQTGPACLIKQPRELRERQQQMETRVCA